MTQLLTVVVIDLIVITYFIRMALIPILFLFLNGFCLNDIDPSSYGEACLLFLVLTIVMVLLLPIFMSFFGGFKLVLRISNFPRPGL